MRIKSQIIVTILSAAALIGLVGGTAVVTQMQLTKSLALTEATSVARELAEMIAFKPADAPLSLFETPQALGELLAAQHTRSRRLPKMKQVYRKGLKHVVVADAPTPVVISNHVLVNPVYSLISSGTESASIHEEIIKEVAENPSQLRKVWDGVKSMGPLATLSEVRAKFREYATIGYAGAGIVSDRHPSVQDVKVGDRVAYGGEGTGHGETILASRNLIVPIPDTVPFEHACFTTLGSIALNSVRISEIGVGDVVAVIGLGLVGQLVVQLARLQGAQVIGIDLRADRVEMAQKLGTDHGLDGSAPIAEQVKCSQTVWALIA